MSASTIKTNRYSLHKYHLEKKFEAGVVLKGNDVKAIRENKFEVREAFVREDKGELYLWNIIFFDHGEEIQKRKLLLNRREIEKILSILKDKKKHGFVLAVRFNDRNKVKIDLGFGQIKKVYEKKSSEKRSSEKRTLERQLASEYGV